MLLDILFSFYHILFADLQNDPNRLVLWQFYMSDRKNQLYNCLLFAALSNAALDILKNHTTDDFLALWNFCADRGNFVLGIYFLVKSFRSFNKPPSLRDTPFIKGALNPRCFATPPL